MAYKSSPRGSRRTDKVAVHTAEGARDAASLGAYFFRPDIQASSHTGIDARNTLQYVPYDRAAWTLRSGNPISDNAELCGFARWTRAQWMSTGVVDGVTNPKAILDRTAAWIRSRCLARGIPIRKIGPADVAAGKAGVIGHYDWTIGARDGTHTDPGTGFPWDYVIDKANNPGGGGAPTPIIPEEIMQLAEPHTLDPATEWRSATFAVEVGGPKGTKGGNSTVVEAMWFNLTSSDFGKGGNTEYSLWVGDDAGNFLGFGEGSHPAEGTVEKSTAMTGNAFRQFVLKPGSRIFTIWWKNNGGAGAGFSFPQRAR